MRFPVGLYGLSVLSRKLMATVQRPLVAIPTEPVIKKISGRVAFEYRNLPFLDEGDLRAMMTNSYDILLCDFLKANLSEGDIMLDVGANIGYIAAFAASCVGATGAVHGFEPLLECFQRLERLRELNPNYRLVFSNVALGSERGMLPIAFDLDGDSRNATLVPGKTSKLTRQVPVIRLDQYIREEIAEPQKIKLIKIDVEGFEYEVLRGATEFLADNRCLPIIVCEIKPWELKRLGSDIKAFDAMLSAFGYLATLIGQPSTRMSLGSMVEMDVVVFRPRSSHSSNLSLA